MTIGAIVQGKGHEIISCTGDMTVSEAINRLAERRIGAMPVVEGERVIGIFSERDAIYCLREHGAAVLERPVSDVMTADVITVERDKSAISALSLMTKRRIRHLPVCEEGRLVAFVSIGDIVKYRVDKVEAEAAAMRDYIRTA